MFIWLGPPGSETGKLKGADTETDSMPPTSNSSLVSLSSIKSPSPRAHTPWPSGVPQPPGPHPAALLNRALLLSAPRLSDPRAFAQVVPPPDRHPPPPFLTLRGLCHHPLTVYTVLVTVHASTMPGTEEVQEIPAGWQRVLDRSQRGQRVESDSPMGHGWHVAVWRARSLWVSQRKLSQARCVGGCGEPLPTARSWAPWSTCPPAGTCK